MGTANLLVLSSIFSRIRLSDGSSEHVVHEKTNALDALAVGRMQTDRWEILIVLGRLGV